MVNGFLDCGCSALKESGYESDSQLVFRRRAEAEAPTDPHDQRVWYRDIQRGGEVPLHGLRKPQPNKTPGALIKIFGVLPRTSWPVSPKVPPPSRRWRH